MQLGEKPKSFIVVACLKGFWPASFDQAYNYTTLEEANKHIKWLVKQVASQQGKDAVRKNVLIGFYLVVRIRAVKRDKHLIPLKRFVKPEAGKIPEGGRRLSSGEWV